MGACASVRHPLLQGPLMPLSHIVWCACLVTIVWGVLLVLSGQTIFWSI